MPTPPAGGRPRIVVTLGDPSGIGPELVVKLLADRANRAKADVLVLASEAEIATAATEAGVAVPLAERPGPDAVCAVGSEYADRPVERGAPTTAGGMRVKSDLLAAIAMYRRGEVDGIMFAPLNKAALHQAGMDAEDELRWLADELGYTGTVSELNFVPGLTTSRVTSHIPFKDVAAHINAHAVYEAIRILDRTIRDSGMERPRLAVCALNPHAGENGQFGDEESVRIAPAVHLAAADGVDVAGPFPADTVFVRARDGEFDGVVTMYHDQGQIAMKLLGFYEGVTVQGGLPVPIATPAHGTAYGIVGKGIANTGPIQKAFDLIVSIAARGRQR